MELKIGEFVFNSQSSLNYGIYVDDVIPFIPPKRLRRQTIAGKSGTFDYGSKDYDDIGVTLKCYSKKDKLTYLNEFDINLNLLKVHVRLSYKYKYISMQNYQSWSSIITDICNMLGGWISSCLKI